jgi:pyruvate/2-oxoglutarate dehydrogenase complex dihydrolipoamide acyltransferase (E2) component
MLALGAIAGCTLMSKSIGSYHVVDFPPERRFMANFLRLTWANKHNMYGLLEVDVTAAKQFIEDHKAQTGELLSFTGYLVLCLARAVEENKAVQACRKGGKQLVVFDEVGVGIMVERKIGERRVLMGEVIRGANHKTYREIHQQIRSAQSSPPVARGSAAALFQSALLLPWPLSRLAGAALRTILRRDPTIGAAIAGTVGISAVGMFGEGQGGWGIAPTMHSLDLIVGSTTWKPVIVDGRIEPREILNLTLVFDHDVIDGAPAARFARRLVELIERGYGLGEEQEFTSPPSQGQGQRQTVRRAERDQR